jgi:hypothetical protein
MKIVDKEGVVVKEVIWVIKEKTSTLHWDNKKDA